MTDKTVSKTVERPKERILYFDVLNVVACLAVIFLHHNVLVHQYKPSVLGAWSQALVVEVVAFFAVPIFLMLSGATLMEYRKRYDTKTFFKKRLTRVLVPFIVWSIIVFFYAVWIGTYKFSELTFSTIFNSLMTQESMLVYWFFPVIISIYLAMPVLSLLAQGANRKWLWYMAGIGLITYSFLPPILNILNLKINAGFAFPLTGSGGYIIYPILGYLLATIKDIKTKWLVFACLGAILTLALRYAVTYMFTIQEGSTNYLLAEYVYFTGVVPAVALFMLARRIPWNSVLKGKAVNILTSVSSCSLGIYLIHMLVMAAEYNVLHQIDTSSLKWRILIPFLTYGICLAIVWLVKRKAGAISRLAFP